MRELQTRYTSINGDEKSSSSIPYGHEQVLDNNLSPRSDIMYCGNLPNL